jgi:hypothetical protein
MNNVDQKVRYCCGSRKDRHCGAGIPIPPLPPSASPSLSRSLRGSATRQFVSTPSGSRETAGRDRDEKPIDINRCRRRVVAPSVQLVHRYLALNILPPPPPPTNKGQHNQSITVVVFRVRGLLTKELVLPGGEGGRGVVANSRWRGEGVGG